MDAFLVNLEHALPLAMGDRFILRDSGRQAVVGGGRVLEPTAPSRIAQDEISLLMSSVAASPNDRATALLSVRGASDIQQIAVASGGGVPRAGLRCGPTVLSQAVADRTLADALAVVSDYHHRFPLRPGVPKAELASQIRTTLSVVDATVVESSLLSETNGYIRDSDFSNHLKPDEATRWSEVKESLERSFDVPRMSALELDEEIVHLLIRDGDLVNVGPDLVFTANQINEIQHRIGDLPDGFSVSQFRDEFSMTRRQAVPTLEWLDKTGWTKRSGDGRSTRPRL
jgi:selenocysteine-specific elongation factor